MKKISTHVLDISAGKPAAGIAIQLDFFAETGWESRAEGATDPDGRCQSLFASDALPAGLYRITFQTGAYFAPRGLRSLYPEIQVTFEVEPHQNYHIPLLLSPFGYSTYRGS